MIPLSWACWRARAQRLAELDHLLPGERRAGRGGHDPLGQDLVQGPAVHVLHGEERRALVLAGGEVADDVRVLELLEDVVLALEPGHGLVVAGQAERDDLEGDPPFRLARFLEQGPVDGAHGPGPEFLLQGERADGLAGVHGRSSAVPEGSGPRESNGRGILPQAGRRPPSRMTTPAVLRPEPSSCSARRYSSPPSSRPPPPAEPLALHPKNPHYFLFRGKPTVLVTSGEHYGAVLNTEFEYGKYLETLAADGLNLTRTWAGPYCEPPGAFNIAENTLAPKAGKVIFPWARTETPGYANGGNKFDLTQVGRGVTSPG